MEIDTKRKAPTVNQMALDMLDERRRMVHYPPPPTCTPSAHTPNLFSGRSSVMRQSTDTPLSMYATHRAKYKMSELSSILSPREVPQTVQVPLSALSSAKAKPGIVGGSFNSTSKMKCIPLPSIYDHNQVTKRGIRNVTVHTERYTPSFHAGDRTRTISDSLLTLTNPRGRQKDHLIDREMNVYRSRSLKKARDQDIPHRLERAFYMNGHSAQFFNRQDLPPDELQALQAMSLTQNKELYYGRGVRSTRQQQLQLGRAPSKAVQRFESQLREARREEEERREFEDSSIDSGTVAGRVHRVSGAITPASPIPEAEEEEKNEIFVTQSESASRDVDNLLILPSAKTL